MTSIPKIIEAFCLDRFEDQVAAASTPAVLRKLIRNTDEFAVLQEQIFSGAINSTHIKASVAELLKSFEKGKPFRFQSALAAIAIAMENSFSEYSDEYLSSLSKVRVAELSIATRVAELAISLKSHSTWTPPHEIKGVLVGLTSGPKTIQFVELQEQESMSCDLTEVVYAQA